MSSILSRVVLTHIQGTRSSNYKQTPTNKTHGTNKDGSGRSHTEGRKTGVQIGTTNPINRTPGVLYKEYELSADRQHTAFSWVSCILTIYTFDCV